MKRSGGPGIFMHRLLSFMERCSMIELVDSAPDLYFATVWLDNPPKNVPIVYRAASCYYDIKQRKRHSLNKRIADAIRRADLVIYQSNFGRKLCERVLKVRAKSCEIIYNGFDSQQTEDCPVYESDCRHVFVACSDWDNPIKRGVDIIKAFCRAQIEDSELIMIGPGLERQTGKHANIRCVGKLPWSQIAAYLKRADVFVHLGFAEVCPNAVIEALCFGCCVVTNNIAGTKELIEHNGITVVCDQSFKFKRHDANLSVNIDVLAETLTKSLNLRYKGFPQQLTMTHCAEQYLQSFHKVLG